MRRRSFCLSLAAALAPVRVSAQTLAGRIESVLRAAQPRHGLWGVHVVDLATGRAVFAHQEDRMFVPASTAKLFSTAYALHRLGAGYRFRTAVAAPSRPDASGVIRGDVRLVGGNDPTLSGRRFPYQRNVQTSDPLDPLAELAAALAREGVRRIEGDIVGDDTACYWEPYPAGRAQEDAIWDYGAPVSALSFNDNRISVSVLPGSRAGDLARVAVSPRLDYFLVQNRVTTVAGRSSNVLVTRAAGSRQIRLWGTIGLQAGGEGRSLAVDDPALFAAAAFREVLMRGGIPVSGRAVARHLYPGEASAKGPGEPGEVVLAERLSPPLSDILTVVNKESVNLHAELLLLEAARRPDGAASRSAALEGLEAFLKEAGIPEGEARLLDASGLSMLNMISPRAVTGLLAWMERSANREAFRNSLAIAGEEGTLRSRFTSQPVARRIQAKTGTLSRVNAIAGYADTAAGGRLAFAVLVNNHTAPGGEVRALIDKICMLLVE